MPKNAEIMYVNCCLQRPHSLDQKQSRADFYLVPHLWQGQGSNPCYLQPSILIQESVEDVLLS